LHAPPRERPSAISFAPPARFRKDWDQAMNVMNYKGYGARIEFDAEDEILVGHLIGIGDIVGFHADDAAGIRRAFEEAVDSYVDLAGESAQKPFSAD
jgi:predicted HicB family RNase H-like nuclease